MAQYLVSLSVKPKDIHTFFGRHCRLSAYYLHKKTFKKRLHCDALEYSSTSGKQSKNA